MPRKIRELIADLEKAGFINRGGKGSHRNFAHPDCPMPITFPVNRVTMQSTTRNGLYANQ
jgi:predicted RNA binding protein YcfA (HicA-like mRNA interferase family)